MAQTITSVEAASPRMVLNRGPEGFPTGNEQGIQSAKQKLAEAICLEVGVGVAGSSGGGGPGGVVGTGSPGAALLEGFGGVVGATGCGKDGEYVGMGNGLVP